MGIVRRVLYVATVASLFACGSTFAGGQNITWEHPQLEITAFPGTSQVTQASFTSSESSDQLTLWLTPELQSMVDVHTSVIESVVAEQINPVGLRFAIPGGTPYGVYEGTLHIRDGRQTVPVVLKISITVAEPSPFSIPESLAKPTADQIIPDGDHADRFFVANELVVRFIEGTDLQSKVDLVAAYGGSFVGSSETMNAYQIRLPDDIDLRDATDQFETHPSVDFVVRHWLSRTNETTNDYFWGKRDANDVVDLDWGQKLIRLPEAWDILQEIRAGQHQSKIAIIDNGFMRAHEDLGDQFRRAFAEIDDDPDSADTRLDWGCLVSSHGTKVAGIIGAERNNDAGIAGMLWGSDIALYSAASNDVNDPNYEKCGLLDHVIGPHQMFDAMQDRVQVISMSASTRSDDAESARKEGRLYELAVASSFNYGEVIFIFAAGNDQTNVSRYWPANLALYHDNVLAVAAVEIGSDGAVSLWDDGCNFLRNRGCASNFGSKNIVAAPGKDIYTTDIRTDETPDGYGFIGMTSAATPFVSGLAGLLFAADSSMEAVEVRRLILAGAVDGETPPVLDQDNNHIPVIDAAESLRALLPECNDNRDNDLDGLVDSDDPGCADATDDDESDDPVPPPPGGDVLTGTFNGVVTGVYTNAAAIPGDIAVGEVIEGQFSFYVDDAIGESGAPGTVVYSFPSVTSGQGLNVSINGLSWSNCGAQYFVGVQNDWGDGGGRPDELGITGRCEGVDPRGYFPGALDRWSFVTVEFSSTSADFLHSSELPSSASDFNFDVGPVHSVTAHGLISSWSETGAYWYIAFSIDLSTLSMVSTNPPLGLVLVDNGAPDLVQGEVVSDLGVGNFVVADDFILSPESSTISKVQWWGGYTGPYLPIQDGFTVRIYEDAGGVPAQTPLISHFWGYTTGPRELVAQDQDGRSTYVYERDFPITTLQPNTRYYISIVNNVSSVYFGDWVWNRSISDRGQLWTRRDDTGPWTQPGAFGRAFRLLNEP